MSGTLMISQIVQWVLLLLLTVAFLTFRSQKEEKKSLAWQSYGLSLMEKFPELENEFISNGKNVHFNEPVDSIVLFTSATCSACNGLYPIISDFSQKYNVEIKLYIQGDTALIQEKINTHQLVVPVLHLNIDLLQQAKIPGIPYAYYLSTSGVIYNKGGVNHEDHLKLLLHDGRKQEKMMRTFKSA